MTLNYKIYKLDDDGLWHISKYYITPVWRIQLMNINHLHEITPISIFSIIGYLYFINNAPILKVSMYDSFLINDIGYEAIQFYINTFGKCTNFKFNRYDLYWNFKIKVTNNLLLELL